MVLRRAWLPLVLVVAALLAYPLDAAADMGPKPQVTVRVAYQGQPVPDPQFTATLLACVEPGSRPFRQVTPVPGRPVLSDPSGCVWQEPSAPVWGGDCLNGECQFTYMLPERFRLAITLPSQGREYLTDVGEREELVSYFSADLAPDGTGHLERLTTPVLERDWSLGGVGLAVGVTLVAELALAFAYATIVKRPRRRLLLTCLFANLITVPCVWLLAGVFYVFAGATLGFVGLAIGEAGAWLAEGLAYKVWGRLSIGGALLLSLAANAASFGVGLLVH